MSANRSGQVVEGWPSSLATEFDGLSVLRLIGEGSVATVFLAREITPERLVALKVLKADLAADAVMRARFHAEALAAARIVHPHVAAIYRVGERGDGLPYIAQEYIGGRSLADLLLSSEVRAVDECTRIVASLARALAGADAKGIVHRNVNPGNVHIEQDSGRVVLTDFGIAERRETKILSDPRYASPEQIRGETPTGASDIFSLGVLAYELLTGRGPYESSTPHELAHARGYAEPLDLRSARSDIPEEVAYLLRRCVDKNPDGRPASEELVRQLTSDERTKPPLESMRLTQRAVESSLMRTAVISGLVMMAMGAALALWLFVSYS